MPEMDSGLSLLKMAEAEDLNIRLECYHIAA